MPLSALLHPWHEFYTLLGTASATMVGLLFVAASVGTGVFTAGRRAPLRVFLSASVVNFSLILATSLIVLAPLTDWRWFGVLVLGCGLFGLMHASLAGRDTLRDGLFRNIDLEDRFWYLVLPIVGYAATVAAGTLSALRLETAPEVLACAMGVLLVAGVHNAWDITVWIITQRRQ